MSNSTPGEPSLGGESNNEADLGPERSIHRARIRGALVPAAITVATILLVGLATTPSLGWRALAIVLPFAAVGGALLGLGPLRLSCVGWTGTVPRV